MTDQEIFLLLICVSISFAVGMFTGYLLSNVDKEE